MIGYFAYGSNLSIEQMTARTGVVPLAPRIGRLEGYRLAFNMQFDGQVYANIQPLGEYVLGVVYWCEPGVLVKLDAFEAGYSRIAVRVDCEGDLVEAIAYTADPEFMFHDGMPSEEYLERILSGARRHGLPDSYIREIESLAREGEIKGKARAPFETEKAE